MANPAITRDQVHTLAEACGDEGEVFQSTATRLIKEQRRLSRFFEQNMETMGVLPGQVSLYMLSVVMRIFEQVGGRMRKVTSRDLAAATAKVQGVAEGLLPPDDGFMDRVKAVDWRAQPHILDEVLWALYERDDEEDEDGEDGEAQADLEPAQSAMIYLMLWTAVEALDTNWTPAPSWSPEG